MSLIFEADLRRYLAAGLVHDISVLHTRDGWSLRIQLGSEFVSLRRQRGGERTFKSLDKLALFLTELGLEQLTVHLRNPSDRPLKASVTQ
ncbi:hypothetical protein [Pseudomonas antarctica]|uniref:hypothetical protein n=1 Tax=Pseudomonas antarctica TaxID=219572 RepID=UPI00387AEE5B